MAEKKTRETAKGSSPSPRSCRSFSFGGSPVIADAVGSTSLAEDMDFGQIQHIANEKVHEEHTLQQAMAVPQFGKPHKQEQEPSNPTRQAASKQFESDGVPTSQSERPRRAIAEIRAAAEQRAYNKKQSGTDESETHPERNQLDTTPPRPSDSIEGTISTVAESRRNMSAIKAIAERRAGGFRNTTPRSTTPRNAAHGNTTPRSITPIQRNALGGEGNYPMESMQYQSSEIIFSPKAEMESLSCGGAYKPSRVYSGRAGVAGGLSDTLGLRFGQRPPARISQSGPETVGL
jgi:hypothetical protein